MRRSLSAVLATALVAVGAACGSDTPTGGTTDVKVGIIPIVDVAPIYLGKQKGFFSNRGINLSMESGQGGAAIVPSVLGGQFQFGFSNLTSLMLAQSQGAQVKVVANGVASTGQDGADFAAIVVKGDSPIQSAKDLAGKKVAVNTLKNISDTAVRESVRKAGGDPSGINFVEISFATMPAQLAAGSVDAALVVEPSLSTVKAQGGRAIASSFVDTAPNLTVAAYFTSTDLLQRDPDLVRRFTEAINESLAYANSHPDEVRAIISTYTKIEPSVVASLTLPKWPTDINRASLERLLELGQADGIFPNRPDLSVLLP